MRVHLRVQLQLAAVAHAARGGGARMAAFHVGLEKRDTPPRYTPKQNPSPPGSARNKSTLRRRQKREVLLLYRRYCRPYCAGGSDK